MRRKRAALAVRDAGRPQAICELFDFLEDVVFWIKDRSGRYVWVNAANFLNLGLSRRDDVVGKTDFDLLPAHIVAQFRVDLHVPGSRHHADRAGDEPARRRAPGRARSPVEG